MQYWADHPFDTTGTALQPVDAVFAQFTSSPFNKEEKDLGKAVHNWGYIPMTGKVRVPSAGSAGVRPLRSAASRR